MAHKTQIQWCDSTVNPAMGCDGCELWPTNPMLKNRLVKELSIHFLSADPIYLKKIVEQAMGDYVATTLWKRKTAIIWTIVEALRDHSDKQLGGYS